MVNYSCPRCGFSNNIKTKYIHHLKRKHLCEAILSNDDLNDEYIKYDITDKIKVELEYCKSNLSQMSALGKSNLSQMSALGKSNLSQFKPITQSKIINKEYKCEYCKKNYNHRQSLHKHLKSCREKKKDEQCKSNMLELINKLNEKLEEKDNQLKKELDKRDKEYKKELDKKNKQIDELIKKTGITNNIQNNIKILAYKNTDISHLTESDYLKCLGHSNFCVPNLIESIHFNPKKPENHNVYISNIKNKYAMVYDGNKWNLNNQDETIENLFDTNHDILEQKLEEWIENGKDYPEIMKKFNRYLEKKENDFVVNSIKKEIKLILFNNRMMISDI